MEEQNLTTNDVFDNEETTELTQNEASPENEEDDFSLAVKPTAENPKTFKIKHLGVEKEVAEEELITLAQKGCDYDRIKEKLENEKNSKANRLLGELASNCSLSLGEYLDSMEKALFDHKVSAYSKGFTEAGFDENAARELALKELEAEGLRKTVSRAESEALAEREELLQRDITGLLKLYPDLKEFPEEVTEICERENVLPSTAYQRYLLEQREIKIKQLEQNEKNALIFSGSLKGEAKAEEDAFLSALFK